MERSRAGETTARKALWLSASCIVLLAQGCFRGGLHPLPGEAGAGGGDGAPDGDEPSVSDGSPGEDADGEPWPPALSAPAPLAEVNTDFTEMDPSLSANGLRLYFASDRPGSAGTDLWVASRPSLSDPFAAAEPVAGVNTSAHEMGPTVSGDELVIVFARVEEPASPRALFEATRSSRAAPFETPVALDAVNADGSSEDPDLSEDGLVLTFGSDRAGGRGGFDIWQASRDRRSDPFGRVTSLEGGAVNGDADDRDPSLAGDWLAFQRPVGECGGGSDIFLARRSPAGRFEEATCLEAICSTLPEIDPCISREHRVILFTRGDSSARDVWVASF